LFSSCVLFIIIGSILWLHMTLLFPYIYLILLYIRLELYVFSACTICNSLVDFRKYSFMLIVLVDQQVSVQNIYSYCLMYKFKTRRLQYCEHDMLMCCRVCEKNRIMWQSVTVQHWSCTIILM
jgi:hypothetical protein